MQYIIYELWNPIINQPFYVGWSDTKNKGHIRPYEHLKEASRHKSGGNQLKLNTIRKINKAGLEVDIHIVKQTNDFEQSLIFEQELIVKWGRRDLNLGPLANMTDGGEGTTGRIDSKETRSKKSKGRLGKRHTSEAIAKIKAARKKQAPPNWSDKSRKKMSEITHLRLNNGKTYEEIYGAEDAALIKEKQSKKLKERRNDPRFETKRKAAHKRTWILKMAVVYQNIFELLDVGKKHYEIRAELNISQDTVRKAVKNRADIEAVINEDK